MSVPTVTQEGPPTQANHNLQSNTLDDIFGSSDSEPGRPLNTAPIEPSEIPRIRSTHVTNGYRDGISESKARYVQDGFDEGYALGAVLGMKAGWILGVAESLAKALGQRKLRRKPRHQMTVGSNSQAEADDESAQKQADLEARRGEMLIEAQAIASLVQEELTLRNLFGREYFGEDGIWIYPVPGNDGEITFQEVASAHPLIQKWTSRLRKLAVSWGVDLDAVERMAEQRDES
ncbi:MAG: Essential protein Yae1, N terminal [Bogoriella megaspora]|nr:MAG: Essential protein Yae1, N terminal [Bogoriella megaspora]